MDGTLLDDAARQAAIVQLNVIVETELAGTVRYTHYALMVYGYNRIPIVSWLRSNAAESLAHAQGALRPGARLRVWSMPDAERRSAPPAPPFDTERVAAPGGRLTQNAGARHPRPHSTRSVQPPPVDG